MAITDPDPSGARRPSLRSQLVWAAGGIVLLTVVLLVVATYRLVVVPAEDELAANAMRLSSARAIERVHALVGALENITRTAREWGLEGLLLIDGHEQFQQVVMPVVLARREITAVVHASEDGREIFLLRTDEGWSRRLTDVTGHPGRQLWRWDTKAGYVGEEWREGDYDPRQRPWFTGALELPREDDVAWTEPYQFFTTGELGVTASARWTDRTTGQRHVIAFDIALNDLSAVTTALGVGEHGRLAILTGDGRLLGLPRTPEPRSEAQARALLLRRPAEAGFPRIGAALARWEGSGRPMATVLPLRTDAGSWLGWFEPIRLGQRSVLVVAVAPHADFAIGRPWHVAAIGGIFLVAFALALLIAREGARRLAGALHALAGSSERIGRLELDQAVTVPARTRELHELVRSQEHMREALLVATSHLEETVEVRTRELAQREEAVRRSREQLRVLLDASPIGVVVSRRDGSVEYVNASALGMFGYPREAFMARLMGSHYVDPQVRESVVTELDRDGRVLNREVAFHRADDTLLWTLDSFITTEWDEGPALVSWLADITPLKQAQEELRAAHHAQSTILETSPFGIVLVVVGPEGRIIERCNRSYELLFGYGPGELIGRSTRLVYPSDDVYADLVRRITAVTENGGSFVGEAEHLRKDGTTVWLQIASRKVNPDDPRSPVVSVMEDVSERKQMLQEIERARLAAEEATRAKSSFLANMSHEIRTPMNAIIGLAHLALRTDLTRKQRDYVEKIHNAGTSLLGLVNDVLDFSKVEAGRIDLERVPFETDEVLSGVSSLVAGKAAAKGLELLVDVASDVPRGFVGDPLRLRQILVNLLDNAIKFTERGQVALSVRALERLGDKTQLRMEIRDTGIGMTPEQVQRLFQPFTQADSSTTRKYGGTGLGLTICKRLVELMGGTLQVDSVAGRGTAFTFTAWLDRGEGPEPRRVLPAALGGLRTLVVDDNADAREILSEMLRGLGCEVAAVDSGEEAVAAVRACDADDPYAVAFLDWKMPGLDGVDTARQLRGERLTRPPRTVLVSGFAGEELAKEGEAAGMEAVLAKPVSQSSLVDTLVTLFAPAEAEVARAAHEAHDTGRLDGVRVLLVEDHEINQQIARELLEGVGAVVTVAGNGREGVERIVAAGPGAFDVVLMDIQMPEMDGLEATRAVRADARFHDLPIIAMTAHAMSDDRERCLEAGMVDHIVKPIDPRAMFGTVTRWVRVDRASAPAPVAGAPAPGPLPRIDGIDVESAVLRAGGRVDLYRTIAHRFVRGEADTAARIGEDLARGARDDARRRAHTLKGLAGTLGAGELAAAAAAVEYALRDGHENPELLAELARSLGATVTALASGLGAEVASATPGTPPVADVAEILDRLAGCLNDGDIEARTILGRHSVALATALGSDRWASLEAAVEHFEFDRALELVRAITRGPNPAPEA